MNKAVLVHLSDIHFNNSEESNDLIKKLCDDLVLMKNEVGTYDLLAITGDCIDRGQVELFEEFNKKLNDILNKCELKKKNRSIIVPGNHDIDRNNKWLANIEDFGDDYEKAHKAIEDDFSIFFKDYNEFVDKFGVPQNGVGVKYFTVNGLVIRAIMLNSSSSTLTHNVYGELIIGDGQLDQVKKQINSRKKKYDITIACMHHPLDWFSYNVRKKLQSFLFNTLKVDFLLHGHIHEASYDSLFNMDASTNIFCTGISYTKSEEKCSRKDGMRYSIYEIDKDTRTVNIYLRATNTKGEFVGDNRLYSTVNKDGFFTVPMGNISECLLPLKKTKKETRNSIFISRDFVELLLHKEQTLFKYYCGMEAVLDQLLSQKDEYIQKWKEEHNLKNLKGQDKENCLKSFYLEQFEIYCMYVLNNLNALFFENHKDVRFLLRRYNPTTNEHIAVSGEGILSTTEDIKKVKSFKWGEGMIYNSYKSKAPLLKSQNLDYHQEGNTHDFWKEYLTMAVDGIEVRRSRELIPLFAINVATNSLDNEKCLQALAMSSIYDILQEVFKLFDYKGYKLLSLYNLE